MTNVKSLETIYPRKRAALLVFIQVFLQLLTNFSYKKKKSNKYFSILKYIFFHDSCHCTIYYISCQINSTVFHIPCDIDIAYHNANIFRSIFDSFLSSDMVLVDDFTNYSFSSCQVIFLICGGLGSIIISEKRDVH